MIKEIWLPVVKWEGYYEVSSLSRIRSITRYRPHWRGGKQVMRGKILNQILRKGYWEVNLSFNNNRLACSVARIVAEAFVPNPNNLPQVNHKDLVKTNNLPPNLEWCTGSYNTQHAWDNGAYANSRVYIKNR